MLNRSDFDEFIETASEDIYSPISYNYAVITLYGLLTSDNDMNTISSDRTHLKPKAYDTDDFSKVYIEVDLQTKKDSLNLIDDKDHTLLLHRNRNNLENLARDLKNTVRSFKIIQKHREQYILSTKAQDLYNEQLMLQDSRSDLESWDGSLGSVDTGQTKRQKDGKNAEVLHPSELLKTGYPEIQKKILDKNEKENIFYIINRKTYE